MTTNVTFIPGRPRTVGEYLDEPLRLGEPDACGPLIVFPVFGPGPELDYVSFAQGCETGVSVKELEAGAVVPDLLVNNPTPTPVLLYAGEEVLGGQQNRTLDTSVLIAAHQSLKVPVTCVEAGRWDHLRHSEAFRPSTQAADPDLRRAKALQTRESRAQGGGSRADQNAVWDEVALRVDRHRIISPTTSMHDVFEGRREELDHLTGGVRLHDGQCGTLVAIGGRFRVLDWVSRSKVFASLHSPLIQGYALDALAYEGASQQQSIWTAETVLANVLDAPLSERDGIGLGRDIELESADLVGDGLAAGRELVQLTVFGTPRPSADGRTGGASIQRPSGRQR